MKYKIAFCYTQYSTGSLVIEANNEQEAESLAEKITVNEIKSLEPIDGELTIEYIEEV